MLRAERCHPPLPAAAPEEEISDAGRELEKLGLQLPAFGRIGGILADELSLDEAAGDVCWGMGGGSLCYPPRPSDVGLPRGGLGGWAASHVSFAVHAAVLAINVAVERGDVGRTMEALLHPGAMLRGLRTALAAAYQDVLRGAQREKGGGREWVRTGVGGWDEGGTRLLQGWARGNQWEMGGVGLFFSLFLLWDGGWEGSGGRRAVTVAPTGPGRRRGHLHPLPDAGGDPGEHQQGEW